MTTNMKDSNNLYAEIINFIKSKQFAKAKLGISDKTAFDWRSTGVYLQQKKTKSRMKYSVIEYIWLLLVKEIRGFGLPLKSVLNLKDILLMPIDLTKLLSAISTDSVTKVKLDGTIESLGQNIVDSMFTSMIVSTLLGNNDYTLLIQKNGSCLIQDRLSALESNSEIVFKKKSCLRIPFKILVQKFLENEKITKYNIGENLNSNIQIFEFNDIKNIDTISSKLKSKIESLIEERDYYQTIYKTIDDKNENKDKV